MLDGSRVERLDWKLIASIEPDKLGTAHLVFQTSVLSEKMLMSSRDL